MLKLFVLIGVVFVQLGSGFVMKFFSDDLQWQLFIMILLATNIALACVYHASLYYNEIRFSLNNCLKGMALIVALINVYYLADYAMITFAENYISFFHRGSLGSG